VKKKFEINAFDAASHRGQVICSSQYLFFVSNMFGEIHRYSYNGEAIQQGRIQCLDQERIKNYRERFLENGQNPNSIAIKDLFVGVSSCNNKFYLLSWAKPMFDEIIEIDQDSLKTLRRYRCYFEIGYNRAEFTTFQTIVKERGSKKDFYVSLIKDDDQEVFVKRYGFGKKMDEKWNGSN